MLLHLFNIRKTFDVPEMHEVVESKCEMTSINSVVSHNPPLCAVYAEDACFSGVMEVTVFVCFFLF